MAVLRRISYRNQITLPPKVLREAGLDYGSLVSIEAKDGKIVLEPKELKGKELSGEDWKALDRFVQKQVKAGKYKEYASLQDARKHLARLKK